MAFRDDRDALVERARALEQQLEAAQQKAKDGERASTELASLKGQLSTVTVERDRLRAGMAPALQRMRTTSIGFAVMLAVGNGVYVYSQSAERAREAARCDERIQELERETDAAEADARRALERASQAETREAERDAREAERAAREAEVPPAPTPAITGIETSGVVAARSGSIAARVGAPCSVDVAYQPRTADCRASITCGGVALYPQAGEGYFPCQVRDARVVQGRDANPTASSHDPEIDVDLDRGTIVVSDEGPAWSITVRLARTDNPF